MPNFFDQIAGTSIGGLVGAMLAIPDEQDPSKPKYTSEFAGEILYNKGELIFQPTELNDWLQFFIVIVVTPLFGILFYFIVKRRFEEDNAEKLF